MRLGYSLIHDPGGSGGSRGIGSLWGSQVGREPIDEDRWALAIQNCELLGSRLWGLCHVGAQYWAHIIGYLLLDWIPSSRSGGGYSSGVASWEEHYWVCGAQLSMGCSCQGHDYLACWSREDRDTGCCLNCDIGLGKPWITWDNWWAYDVGWECFGWNLLWMGPDDSVIDETIAGYLQDVSESWLHFWYSTMCVLLWEDTHYALSCANLRWGPIGAQDVSMGATIVERRRRGSQTSVPTQVFHTLG